ncbi:MAG: carboxypeptidase regulatory-like domain-containing protein [Bacteroidia bacterium]
MNKRNIILVLSFGICMLWGLDAFAQIEKPERPERDRNPRSESSTLESVRERNFNKPAKSRKKSGELTREVKGIVRDEDTGRPIGEVSIHLSDSTKSYKGDTDTTGVFSVSKVPLGRKTLRLMRDGYEPYVATDFLVAGGELPPLEFTMRQLIPAPDSGETVLDSVTITTQKIRQLSGISTRSFTVEEARRYAAAYFDPARLAQSYPGVVNANDQANNISVRGNSPNGLKWRLEGVEIVNPNHLTNAGVASDRPTLRGGGVNILSTQMMATSTFQTGAFDSRVGDALGGVMDISLRDGNPEKDNYVLQLGLLGIDVAAEGPIGNGGKAALLGNYRYSTVGLLDAVGVDVGDEMINFQDASFHATFPNTAFGEVNLFGMGGKSSNRFRGDSVQFAQEIKDRYDIDYENRMGALGLTHKLILGTRAVWRNTIVVSAAEATRQAQYIDTLDSRFDVTRRLKEDDLYRESRLAIRTSLVHKLGGSGSVELGGYATRIGFGLSSLYQAPLDNDTIANVLPRTSATGFTWLYQPYVRVRKRLGKRLDLEAGVHAMALDLNKSFVIEPRARAAYQISDKHAVGLAYGMHSQMQPLSLYFSPVPTGDDTSYVNRNLGFTRAHHAVLSYTFRYNPSLSLKIEPYAQLLFDVPIIDRQSSSVSALNLLEEIVSDTFANTGTGRNVGVELSIEKNLNKDYYFLLSGTYYQSTYVGGDGQERDTRFNGNYALALTGGKEFISKRANHQGIWAIDTRIFAQGGQRETPIDNVRSRLEGRTVYFDELAFQDQLPAVVRADIRISHTVHKANYTRTFSIDIQNVLNRQNVAYRFYDVQQEEVITRFQLGRIPLLTYRVSF